MARNKFNARKTQVDGFTFDSKAEADRYSELKLLERGKEITHLELQPEYEISVNGRAICKYRADFRYFDARRQKRVVEDVKGYKTDVYKLKKKLVEACYPGTEIEEVYRK